MVNLQSMVNLQTISIINEQDRQVKEFKEKLMGVLFPVPLPEEQISSQE